MATLHITRGLPGSGKTYWAGQWTAEDTENRVRVNRDDIRQMLDDGRFVKGVTEQRVIAVRDTSILTLLRRGLDVVCDDTNLPSRTVRDLMKLAEKAGADIDVHDFTDTPLDVCVARDAARDRTVGEEVISGLHVRYVNGKPYPLPMPEAHADMAPTPVINVATALRAAGNRIVFLSGRTDACRDATVTWLHRHVGGNFDGPYMRKTGDKRRDSIVKAELFDRHVRDVYDVSRVLDDRKQVVETWRAMGLTVLQVAEGDF